MLPGSPAGPVTAKREIEVDAVELDNVEVEMREAAKSAPAATNVLPRTFRIREQNKGYASNKASTGKYTFWNCCPLFTIDLFHPVENLPNIYYLIIGGLQMIPSISFGFPVGGGIPIGFPITWVNVGIMYIQETVEKLLIDAGRHRADKRTNGQKVTVLRDDGTFDPEGTWGEVKVGDVLRIHDRENFPADLLFLRASDPMPGQAWVNTKPLDGESDTKLKLAPKMTVELLNHMQPQKLLSVLRGSMFKEGERGLPPRRSEPRSSRLSARLAPSRSLQHPMIKSTISRDSLGSKGAIPSSSSGRTCCCAAVSCVRRSGSSGWSSRPARRPRSTTQLTTNRDPK